MKRQHKVWSANNFWGKCACLCMALGVVFQAESIDARNIDAPVPPALNPFGVSGQTIDNQALGSATSSPVVTIKNDYKLFHLQEYDASASGINAIETLDSGRNIIIVDEKKHKVSRDRSHRNDDTNDTKSAEQQALDSTYFDLSLDQLTRVSLK